jgi:hypothetical protein
MMAGGGDMLHQRIRGGPPQKQADVTPRFTLVQTIERMARGHARLAAGAAIQVHFEGVLLPRPRGVRRGRRAE